ncbi:dual specificity protein phosphatase 26-like isoform X1 [Thunnus maccoyii]|uniref:dual specificity protein phosphatase 26-like isoform X1 n=1 Tax=Thunnus maccoyii TaxID=8240 RepID=UPI001C4CABBD|nr:dual specificity protein phosphatase 26-like isoform X1 [Thunnus maccoyii]
MSCESPTRPVPQMQKGQGSGYHPPGTQRARVAGPEGPGPAVRRLSQQLRCCWEGCTFPGVQSSILTLAPSFLWDQTDQGQRSGKFSGTRGEGRHRETRSADTARHSAENQADLSRHRITHILNAAHSKRRGQPDIYEGMNITYMGIEAHDSCSFNMSVNFQAAADFIHRALSRGGKVLVHCHVGVSRSATLVLAYMMLKQNLTLVEAICAVKENRGVIPNRGFLRQLIHLDRQLFGKHH